jgi:hypothetical protein
LCNEVFDVFPVWCQVWTDSDLVISECSRDVGFVSLKISLCHFSRSFSEISSSSFNISRKTAACDSVSRMSRSGLFGAILSSRINLASSRVIVEPSMAFVLYVKAKAISCNSWFLADGGVFFHSFWKSFLFFLVFQRVLHGGCA